MGIRSNPTENFYVIGPLAKIDATSREYSLSCKIIN